MRKRKIWLLRIMVVSLLFSQSVPAAFVSASEDSEYEEYGEYEDDTEEETEPPLPDSYYLPIESNEIEGWPEGPQIEAEAAVVMDADTGTFLYSKNMYAKEYPASITKIMTTLIALEKGDLTEKITFSENAVYSLEEGSSHAGIQVGEVMQMNRALYGLMLESANDIANGIAETVGGSIEGFAEMMNQRAAELGCVNTHFVNPHGLHNENHYTCARDMALITRAALQYHAFRKIAGTRTYVCPKTNMVDEERYWYNHNQMIQPEKPYYYEDCFGGKTGFTSDALNTLVTFSRRDGRTLICVELRVNGSDKAYSESQQMLEYAFNNFENVSISTTDVNLDKTRAQVMGMDTLGELRLLENSDLQETVLKSSQEVLVTVPKGADVSDIVRSTDENGVLNYAFNGWNVGSTQLSVSSLNFEVPTPKTVALTYTEIVEETEPGIKGVIQVAYRGTKSLGKNVMAAASDLAEKIPEAASNVPGWLQNIKNSFLDLVDWLNENDIMAAVLGMLLLIILLPILAIAWARNSRTQKIRKLRKKEREERVRIEKNIDSKSVSEIEAELRAEIEKDRLERQQAVEEARKIHVKEQNHTAEEAPQRENTEKSKEEGL